MKEIIQFDDEFTKLYQLNKPIKGCKAVGKKISGDEITYYLLEVKNGWDLSPTDWFLITPTHIKFTEDDLHDSEWTQGIL